MDENPFGLSPVQSLPSVDCSSEDFVLDRETMDSLEKLGFITSPGTDETHEVNDAVFGGPRSSLVELDMAGVYASKTNLMGNSSVSTANQGSLLDSKNPWGSVQNPMIETHCDVMNSNFLSNSIHLNAHAGDDSFDQSTTEVELGVMKDHEVSSASVSQIAIPNLHYAPSWECLEYSQCQFRNDECRFQIPSSPSNSMMPTLFYADQVCSASDSNVLSSHGKQNCSQMNESMSSNGLAVASSFLLQNHQDREANCTFMGCRGSCLMPQQRKPFASNRFEELYYSIMEQNHPNSPYEELNLLQQTPLLPEQMPTIPIFSKFVDTRIYDEFQTKEIVRRLITRQDGALLAASCTRNGSFAIMERIKTIQRSSELVGEMMSVLAPEYLNLMQSEWGSHVNKHCIDHFTNDQNHSLIQFIVENCAFLSENRWGYLIVKVCIRSLANPYKNFLLNKIADQAIRLSQHSIGNFVIQDVLESHVPNIVQRICCQELKGKYASLSTNKFSSHVVEKCIQSSQANIVIEELIISNNLPNIICNPFGNYVIQTALRAAKKNLFDRLVETILAKHEGLQDRRYARHIFKVIRNVTVQKSKKGLPCREITSESIVGCIIRE